MTECERDRRIAALKPGIHYREGTRRPYRAFPHDFRELRLRFGSDPEIEEHYGAHSRCISRWIDEAGGDELRAARSAITGMLQRPAYRSRLPTYAQAVASLLSDPTLIR